MSIECAVCMTDFGVSENCPNPDKSEVFALKCGHIYHGDCIRKWFMMRFHALHGVPVNPTGVETQRLYAYGTCPTCNSYVFMRDALKVYFSVVKADGEKTVDELEKEVDKLKKMNASFEKKVEDLTVRLKKSQKQISAKTRILKAQDEEMTALRAIFPRLPPIVVIE